MLVFGRCCSHKQRMSKDEPVGAQMVWAGPGPARQAGVFGGHPASRCRRRAAAVAGSSSTDRWEAESSSTARCQLSITLVLGIEHGEAEREAAARRPDARTISSSQAKVTPGRGR